MKKLLSTLLFLLLSISIALGQSSVTTNTTLTQSGLVVNVLNPVQNSTSLTVAYQVSGSPSAMTIALYGIDQFGGVSLLDTYVGTSSTTRTVSVSSNYTTFQYVPTWTGSSVLIVATLTISGTSPPFVGSALPNGTTATTQPLADNTAKVATDAFVIANAGSGGLPGGGDTAVQFNHPLGTFAGDAINFSYNSTTHVLTATGGFSTGPAAGPVLSPILPNASQVGNETYTCPAAQASAGLWFVDGTAAGNFSTKSLQGTDTKVMTAGTVSGISSPLCTDTNGGATTTGCPAASAPITVVGQQILSVAANSVTFSSIPGTHSDLMLTVRGRCDDAATTVSNVGLQFNADTTASYDVQVLQATNTSASGFAQSANTSMYVGSVPGGTATANVAGQFTLWVVGYSGSSFFKNVTTSDGWFGTLGTATTYEKRDVIGNWRNTGAIISITILDQGGGNFLAGTRFTLYALN